jgi:hypothetical protein
MYKAALVAVNDNSTFVMPSNGSTAFGEPAQWSSGLFYGNRATLLGDVNGDRKLDVVAVNNDSVWAMVSSGSGFGGPTQWLGNQPNPAPFGTKATLMGGVSPPNPPADLIAVNDGNTYVMLSYQGRFLSPTLWRNEAFYGSRATL